MSEFTWDCRGLRDRRENNTLNRVENIQEQSRVNGGPNVK